MRQRLLILSAVIVVTVLAYSSVRTAGFVYEDSNAVWNHAGVLGTQPIDVLRARWMTALSHRLVFTAFGHDPRASHLTNLALHIGNGLWVYALAVLWVSPPAALLAATVFLLHPIQTEAVAYVASRSELLSTFFALAALWVGQRGGCWRSTLMWTCVLAAVCAKESTVVIVPLIALVDLLQGRKLSWWRLSWLAVPALGIAASVLLLDYTTRTDEGPLAYMALQATAVWRYVAMIPVALGQTIDHDFVIVPAAIQWLALTALTLTVLLAVTAWLVLKALDHAPIVRIVGFSIAWAAVALLPRFIVQTPEMLNEHQMYFPMVGLSVAIGAVIADWAMRAERPVGMVPPELEWM